MQLLDGLIAASALLALLLGIGQYLRRRERQLPLFGTLLLVVGALQAAGLLLPEGPVSFGPRLLLYTSLKLLLAPLLLFLFRYLAGSTTAPTRLQLLHFLPAVLLTSVTLLLLAGTARFISGQVLGVMHWREPGGISSRLLTALSSGYVVAYLLWGLFAFDVRRLLQAPRSLGTLLALLALLPTGVVTIWFLVQPNASVLRAAHGFGAFVLAVYVLLAERDPDVLHRMRQTARRYGRSPLSGIDLPRLENQLLQLMETEHVYRMEDLTLPRLAALLGISTHQLSHYLNQHRGQNFPSFVNRYRVREAQELLSKDARRTSLSVAMQVGFNSYTAFHSAFLRETGVPPGRFRRRRR